MKLAIVLDCSDAARLVEFWSTALGYRHAGAVPGFEVLAPKEGAAPGPAFLLQQVEDPRSGKNRMHVDVHPPLDLGVPALVARLEELGGRRVGDPVTELLDALGIWWQTMVDPEGNVFDVVADPGHPAPSRDG
jgi:hypothetical protein